MTAEGEAGVPVGTPCREQQCRCGCLDHERGDDRKAGHGQTLPRARDRQPQDGLDVAQAECAGDDGKDHEDAGYDSDADAARSTRWRSWWTTATLVMLTAQNAAPGVTRASGSR
jgi:hypothetical protein